mmetsp:Transcript_14130/g.26565  ORF Transcript_14130/g.26565 Transcript_14130/m.26565 type:complete len:650 (+) Transcript_14130:96-2045(+)|eukprot:CAMPEP_0204897670 /NCGR_PEP_ID=MMETSP1397-20131031/867_1 /ASSEMBLY_ACC=CAM_ASM_000891 /TAXON_ID=49980 /ORGANISM="Climacostomum Climacostomum virens, Strain Stock W-24" /LENGTH=649 /DNA_ID=CAMNT_0052065447 /DNA_START=35 /DNA_END=1984 /DNA_ORIENTATION=-
MRNFKSPELTPVHSSISCNTDESSPHKSSKGSPSLKSMQSTLSLTANDPRSASESAPTEGHTLPDSLTDLTESFADSGSMCEGVGSILIQRLPKPSATPATCLPPSNHSGLANSLLAALTSNRLKSYGSVSQDDADRLLIEVVTHDLEKYVKPLVDGSLLGLCCNPNASNPDGLTPLHIAARDGQLKTIELILDYGVGTEIDRINKTGMTPLHLACVGGHLNATQLLIRSGACPDVADNDSNTPLHYAVMNKHFEVVKWLMSRTIRLDLRNRMGKTASDLASDPRIISIFARKRPRNTQAYSHDVTIYNSTPDMLDMMTATTLTPRDERISPQHFELLYELGRGSFGEVYLVRKRDSRDLYAMKVLRKDKIMKHNLVKYAMTERNVLSYIRHPFIVGLNYAFQTSEKLFLILDYCPGGDLSGQISRAKRFSEDLARIYVCEVLLALEELHSRDIIFRDLKPDNVVLDAEGHAMLTDFGLSKEGVLDNYAARSFCGSVAYLAPEVLRRQGHGKAVDWYLLGVLFYEMLVGKPPYFSHNREELFHNIQCGKLKIPSSLTTEAKGLLIGLLQRDPKKRLGSNQDAEEVKRHEFFSGVRWEQVMNRSLRPPKPQSPPVKSQTLDPAHVYGSLEESKDSRTHLSGWSFANEIGN